MARAKSRLRGWVPCAVYVSLAVLHLAVLVRPGVSDAGYKPASPAQLQGLQDQVATMQAQLGTKEAELRALNDKIAEIKLQIKGLGAIQDSGGILGGNWTSGENLGLGGGQAALQFQLAGLESQRDAMSRQISNLRQQIAQAQATANYWRDPIGADLQNEREHLRNLQSQPSTSDDQGQRQWDIENTQQRIKELEDMKRQQQSDPGGGQGTSGGQSDQRQGSSFAAPPPGYGASGGDGSESHHHGTSSSDDP